MGKIKDTYDTVMGRNLPTSGTVKGKAIQPPTFLDYGGVVGRQAINKDPIFWLAIQAKGSKKIRDVKVTKKVWDSLKDGDTWTATA